MIQTIAIGRYVAGGPWAERLLTSQVQHLKASFRTGERREERRLFGPDGEIVDQAAARALLRVAGGARVAFHRVILSTPAVARRDDLETWTRLVLMDIGQARGQRLVWAAAVHGNTTHIHAHILLGGRAVRTCWPDMGTTTDVELHLTDYALLRARGDTRAGHIAVLR